MIQIISFHSFRRGTGKSSLAANVATVLATQGRRVGVVDTDLRSPSLHIFFGLGEGEITHTLNHYLRGECDIQQATFDVTPRLGVSVEGRVYLVTASTQINEITRMLRAGYDVDVLNEGLRILFKALALDLLIIDTFAGLNEETLFSMAITDSMVIILRPDQQDYQGTAVMLDVARKLVTAQVFLVVNQVLASFDLAEVKLQVEQAYGCKVAGVLPVSEQVTHLGSAGIFCLRYPHHLFTRSLVEIVTQVTKVG